MDKLVMAGQLILGLSILIVLHELGHFLPAVWFKTRVEKFYLFFDPYFSLFKKKIGDTEWGIGWIPLGGYVKISGMIDESMDKEQMAQEAQPWEFRSKPAWQRLIIMLGGVTVNFIVGIIIFWVLFYQNGESFLKPSNMKYGMVADTIATSIGIQSGDKVIGYNGDKEFTSFDEIRGKMIIDYAHSLQIERNGSKMDIPVSKNTLRQILEANEGNGFLWPAFPAEIDSVMPDSSFAKAGGMKGDKVLAIGDKKVNYYYDMTLILRSYKNQQVPVMVLRNTDTVLLKVSVPQSCKFGVSSKDMESYFEVTKVEYGIGTAFTRSLNKVWNLIASIVKQFRIIFDFELKGYRYLGGFASIGKGYGASFSWTNFWAFTGFISVMLAFMNLLPIPALDGGHVIFTLYEMITGRKPSDKFMEYAQMVGMAILFSLLIFANGNDVYKWIVSIIGK